MVKYGGVVENFKKINLVEKHLNIYRKINNYNNLLFLNKIKIISKINEMSFN